MTPEPKAQAKEGRAETGGQGQLRPALSVLLLVLLALWPALASAGPPEPPEEADLGEAGEGETGEGETGETGETGEEEAGETGEEAGEAETGLSAPAPPPPPMDCEIRNAFDPLAPALVILERLEAVGHLEISECVQISRSGGAPRVLGARVQGEDQALLLYRLETLAAAGFEVYVTPTDEFEVVLRISPAVVGGSVYYINVDRISLEGSFVEGDDRDRVELVIGLRKGNFYPFEYAARLAELGYRASFIPKSAGEVVIQVRPGRVIRRVRVRGHVPLAKRDITRQLSTAAQPGALAQGNCIEPKRLRQGDPPPICEDGDIACEEWQRDELTRLDTFLYDSGYFEGKAALALVCGRALDEADLYVLLDKGRGFRVQRGSVSVVETGLREDQKELAETQDRRWIRRQFMPKVLGLFRTRITREFMDEAVEKVERAYAEPSGAAGAFWTEGSLPYPEVGVSLRFEDDLSYDELTPEAKFDDHDVAIDVHITRGPGVQTEFRSVGSSAARGARGQRRPLRFSESQLRAQLQLFNRRESATPAAARRESANLRAFYQSKGHLFASVDGLHLDFKSIDKLRFEIREGPQVRIADLELIRPARLIPAVAKRIEGRWNEARNLRRRGVFSEAEALSDIQELIAAYNAEGYLCAQIEIELAFWKEGLDAAAEEGLAARLTVESLLDSGGKPTWLEDFNADGLAGIMANDHAEVWVRFRVRPGPRVVTSATEEVRYLEQRIPFSRSVEDLILRDPATQEVFWGAPRMLRGGPLRRSDDKPGGISVTPSLDRDARAAIVHSYRDNGFAVSDAELTWRYTNLRGESVEIRGARNLPEAVCSDRAYEQVAPVDPIIHVYEGRRGEFGDILFRGNFKTHKWVLERELAFETRQAYSQELVDQSAAAIEATGVTRSVTITPYPVGCFWDEEAPCLVHQVIAIEEAKDVTAQVDFGFGAATLNPFYLFANPSFPNLFGTAWDLNLEGRWGFDLSEVLGNTELCAGQECYERLAAATLSRRHVFDTALDLDINSRIQQRATPARGTITSVIGSFRLSRRFQEWTFYVGYLIQYANVSKDLVKPLAGSNSGWINRGGGIVSDLTGLVDTGAVINRVDNPLNPYDGFMASMDIKLASPWFGGKDWWARLDLSWRHFIPIPRTQDRLNFRYSLRYGQLVPFSGPGFGGSTVGTSTVPDVWRYYGGGTADLGLRGILPETMLVDIEEVALPYGGTVLRPRAQGGHIRAIGSVAVQVTSVKDIFGGKLAHSLFYDFGVLTQFWTKFDVRRDFRHSIGVNALKLDINIVTMALGYAVLLPGRYNVGPTDDVNGRFVFDVGVTF